MGNLRESRKGAIEGIFGYLTKQNTADIVPPGESAKKADLFIAVNASTVELTDIEKYIEATVGDKPLIIWNMELDTLRSDLGICLYLTHNHISAFFHAPTLFPRPFSSSLPSRTSNIDFRIKAGNTAVTCSQLCCLVPCEYREPICVYLYLQSCFPPAFQPSKQHLT